MIAELARTLAEATLATSLAAAMVLALRRPLLARLGASVTYAAWLLVPVAALAVMLPSPERITTDVMVLRETTRASQETGLPLLTHGQLLLPAALAIWLLGACVTALLLWRQQRAFLRAIRGGVRRADGVVESPATLGLPAVVGMLQPRIVLPADFDTRYDAAERELILLHERIHVRRYDLQANALAAALRTLFWFNPLLHHAAARFRRDQELACDERVIAEHPHQRRRYAEAMLKTHMAGSPLPIGCNWQDAAPLKERIAMLKLHAPGAARSLIGAALVVVLTAAGGYGAWAAQPARDPAITESRYAVFLTLDIDGESRRFEIHQAAGAPFSLSTEAGDHRYHGTFNLRDLDDDTALLEAELLKDGKRLSSPRVRVPMGRPARIESGSPGGPVFALTAIVTRASDDQQSPPAVESAGPGEAPDYPADALQQGLGGRVVLQVDYAEDGSVKNVAVAESQPAGVFDATAIQMARKMKFSPAIVDGRPVQGSVRLPMRFDATPTPP